MPQPSKGNFILIALATVSVCFFLFNFVLLRQPSIDNCPPCETKCECPISPNQPNSNSNTNSKTNSKSIVNSYTLRNPSSKKPSPYVEKYPKNPFTEPITPTEKYHPSIKKLVNSLDSEFHPSKFIVAIVATQNRPGHFVHAMMRSLRQVLYWNPENTILFQYGDGPVINELVSKLGIRQIKNPIISKYKGKKLTEGAQHIALHYKFVLTTVFEMYKDIKYFIVVEDDMIFAPDFLLYFSQTAHLLLNDPTVYAISAYNDNGFSGLVKHDNMVHRTDFFIGLGWLVSRKLWETEWKPKWPNNHWDHFLRLPYNRKKRQTIYPQIPRVYHSGYAGTHADMSFYERYFRNIHLNLNGYAPLGISAEAFERGEYKIDIEKDEPHTLAYLEQVEYRKFMDHYLDPNNPNTIYIQDLNELTKHKGKNLIFFYQASSAINNKEWEKISKYFSIWHSSPVRSEWEGIVPFWWADNYVLIVASYSLYYERYKAHGTIIPLSKFEDEPDWNPPTLRPLIDVLTSERGESCTKACISNFGSKTRVDLGFIAAKLNNCRALRKYFACKRCEGNMGYDQPAMDMDSGICLWNQDQRTYATTADGYHPKTKRLCACFNEDNVRIIHTEWDKFIAEAAMQGLNPNL